MFTVSLENQDFTKRTMGSVELRPTRYSFKRMGGPDQASISVSGSDVWAILNWLRSPITIYNQHGRPVWWGYVFEASVSAGSLSIGASLSEMTNKVAVTYQSTPAGGTSSTETTTAYTTDAWSAEFYGTKEQIFNLDITESAQATQYRDVLLENLKWPQVQMTTSGGGRRTALGSLECRGWWSTLGWLHYTNAGTVSTATDVQIKDAFTDFESTNDFFTGVEIQSTSGVSSNEYRDGSRTHQQEIEDLLNSGTTNDRRMGAQVIEDRSVWQYEEEANTAINYYLAADGKFRNSFNQELDTGVCFVGSWCSLRDVIPDLVGQATLGRVSPFFVERCEYNIDSDSYTIEPDGDVSPWTLGA